MADCLTHARRYRSHIVTWEEIRTMWNGMINDGGANGAVVFAMAGQQEPEFALVTNYGGEDECGDEFECNEPRPFPLMFRR